MLASAVSVPIPIGLKYITLLPFASVFASDEVESAIAAGLICEGVVLFTLTATGNHIPLSVGSPLSSTRTRK